MITDISIFQSEKGDLLGTEDLLGLSAAVTWTSISALLCVCELLSCVWLFATPQTVTLQASLSMEFSRQEYWSGLPFPSPEDLPNPGVEPRSPALQADSLPAEPQGKPTSSHVLLPFKFYGSPKNSLTWHLHCEFDMNLYLLCLKLCPLASPLVTESCSSRGA